MKRIIVNMVVALALLLACVAPAAAQGLLPIPPIWPPMPPLPTPEPQRDLLELSSYDVRVAVIGQVATFEVELVLNNAGRRNAEAHFVMPLPGQAAVTALSLWIDGRRVEAQLLPADQALQTYTDIVRQQRDPALLEYAGQSALRARVFPVPAQGSARVQVSFTQVLEAETGLVALEYPFGTSLPAASDLQLTLTATLGAAQGVGAVYSPTHEIQVQRRGSGATVSLASMGRADERPLIIYYGVQQEGVAAAVMSHRAPGEDGHLILLLAPPAATAATRPVSRDIILVLDTSGSMRGEKLEQARDAAAYVLQNLNPGDRFGLISFGSSVYPYFERLLELDAVPDALRHLQELRAEGGTNIDGALAAALELADQGRPQVLLFLTDGLPTVGQVAVDKILANLSERAGPDLQLFSFGVGYDVNTLLLDRASLDHHGTASYVRPGEDIELRVSSLYDKISLPVLTDVALTLRGIGSYDVYPAPLPDLFAGEQLLVVGRYRQAGAFTGELTGTRDGRTQKQVIEGLTLAREGGDSFVPAVWAARKVGYLLAEIRLHGADEELVDEVIALAERYGILTPYTSFLADELEDASQALAPMLSGPVSLDNRILPAPESDTYGKRALSASGAPAVEQSIAEQALRDSERPAAAATQRAVGDKTFVLTAGVWIDTAYAPGMPAETVAIGSARYLQLLQEHREWGRYLALGLRVTLVYEGRAYRFVE